MANLIFRTALTGGAAGALDNVDGALISEDWVAVVFDKANSLIRFYAVDADSGAPESSPEIIAPDVNAGNKRWVQVATYTGLEIGVDVLAPDGDGSKLTGISIEDVDPTSLADDSYDGDTITMTAGEALASSDLFSPYYIKYSVDGPRVFKWQADNTFSDNQTYVPVGIIADATFPVSIGDTITVTVPGKYWAFRDDGLALTGTNVGKSLYVNAAGGWTEDPATDLASGDTWCDLGIILSVSPTIITNNPTADIITVQ